ncbi:hypothetical protein GGI25_000425, partial [Coemansia spiralis]
NTAGSDSPGKTNPTSGLAISAVAAAAAGRVTQACASCRRKKVRCDGVQPVCGNCVSRGISCAYLAQKKRGRPPKSQQEAQQNQFQQHNLSMPYYSATNARSIPASSGPGLNQQQQQQQQQLSNALAFSNDRSIAMLAAAGPAWDDAFRHGPVSHAPSALQSTPLAIDTSGVSSTRIPVSGIMHIAHTPLDSSKPLASPPATSHAYSLGYTSIQLGQVPVSATPMNVASPGISTGASSSAVFNSPIGHFGNNVVSAPVDDGRQHSQPLSNAVPFSASIPTSFQSIYPYSQQQQQQQQQGGNPNSISSIHAEIPAADYFGKVPTSAGDAPQTCTSTDSVDIQGIAFSLPPNMHLFDSPGIPSAGTGNHHGIYQASVASGFSNLDLSTPGADADHSVQFMAPIWNPSSFTHSSQNQGNVSDNQISFSSFPSELLPFTAPPPMPPVLQQHIQELPPFYAAMHTVSPRRPDAAEQDALSFTLGNVAMAIAKKDTDSNCIQSTLDHLLYVTKDISNASQEAFEHAQEVAAEAMATIDSAIHADEWSRHDEVLNAPIHETLLRMERRPEISSKAVHNYFCYIHHQCPIIHKPSFLRQMGDGTVNHFVWFALRAFSARTLLHSHSLSKDEVLIEEEYFATKAQMKLATELNKPDVEAVQGLALLSLYIFGTPRWQEASMYWCKATRLAQLMGYHAIDAPTQTIATKMHFGIFEPQKKGPVLRSGLALIPGDFSGVHVPLAQVLTPLEAELRRRLWWILFTNERFCAIAERLPTMVDESRVFVHFPCSAKEWDQPVFTYKAPARVPRYRRHGYLCPEEGDDLNKLTLAQEMMSRKYDNPYLMAEIEYGFTMSHLVAFLADMGALFPPRSPYRNEYIPMFLGVSWQNKMKLLRASVERVEQLLETERQDILHRFAAPPQQGSASQLIPSAHANAGVGHIRKKRDICSSDSRDNRATRSYSHNELATDNDHRKSVDPVLDEEANVPGIEIPHLHLLNMLILYSVLNIHLYRMVFQIHYEFSSSLPEISKRRQDDRDLLVAFDQYVKELWQRTTTAAQQVSRILRGEFPGVPHWVLKLAGIIEANNDTLGVPDSSNTPTALFGSQRSESCDDNMLSHSAGERSQDTPLFGKMDVDSDPGSIAQQQASTSQPVTTAQRLKRVFRERIKAQEMRLHEMTISVFSSFRRTLPYALLLSAKVHVDNIEWWTNETQNEEMARAYLDLAVIVRFLETHQTAFSSTDYVALVKGMMRTDIP